MKAAAVFVLAAVVATSAYAQCGEACAPLSPLNTFIKWTDASGQCTFLSGPCAAGEALAFSVGTLGVSLACQTHTIQWDFGDGTTASGASPTHVYAAPGTYNVTLTINGCGTLVLTAAVTVAAGGAPVSPAALVLLALSLAGAGFFVLKR
jgi:chitodextrinase